MGWMRGLRGSVYGEKRGQLNQNLMISNNEGAIELRQRS
jgi:hypothetical protein